MYKDIWNAVVNKKLIYRRELFNSTNPFTSAVVKEGTTVSHIPGKILPFCLLFLRKNGTVVYKVTGSSAILEILPQGGLKLSCIQKFWMSAKDIDKVKKLLQDALYKFNICFETMEST